jgi:hypothetical protein
MGARSLGIRGSSRARVVFAVRSSEEAALADLDGRSKVRVECSPARRSAGAGRVPAPREGDFDCVDLLMRALGAFARVERG